MNKATNQPRREISSMSYEAAVALKCCYVCQASMYCDKFCGAPTNCVLNEQETCVRHAICSTRFTAIAPPKIDIRVVWACRKVCGLDHDREDD